MGLLRKLAESLEGRSPRPSALEIRQEIREIAKDGRLHARYPIPATLRAELWLPGDIRTSIANVSYGGLGLELDHTGSDLNMPSELTARLRALDMELACKVRVIRKAQGHDQKAFWGIAFCHDTPNALDFLRPMIDGLRLGATLALVPIHVRREIYQAPDWHCVRGEGPCDLLVRLSEHRMAQALLTIPWKGSYGELSYSGGRLETREALPNALQGERRSITQMQATHTANQELLRRAAWILGGAPAIISHCTQPLLDETLRLIS